jgi:hypothetical protein
LPPNSISTSEGFAAIIEATRSSALLVVSPLTPALTDLHVDAFGCQRALELRRKVLSARDSVAFRDAVAEGHNYGRRRQERR